MATFKANIEVVNYTPRPFTNANSNDLIMYVSNSNQRIIVGASNTAGTIMITSSNMGIGLSNSTPTQTLDVNGNINCSGTISANNILCFKNRIINGDMRISQRGTTFTLSGINQTNWSLDRWKNYYNISAGSGIAVSQCNLTVADAPFLRGIRTSIRGAPITNNTISYCYPFYQVIEGNYMSDLLWGTSAAQPASLSFWMRTNASNNSRIPICLCNSNNTLNWNSNVLVTSSSNWQYVTTQIPGPTSSLFPADNGGCVEVFIGCINTGSLATNVGVWENSTAVGHTTSTNLWSTTPLYFEMTGVQLEEGNVATPFEFRPYPIELQLCQRYYEVLTTPSTVMGTVTHVFIGDAGGLYDINIPFMVTKRGVPTSVSNSMVSAWSGLTLHGTINCTTQYARFGVALNNSKQIGSTGSYWGGVNVGGTLAVNAEL